MLRATRCVCHSEARVTDLVLDPPWRCALSQDLGGIRPRDKKMESSRDSHVRLCICVCVCPCVCGGAVSLISRQPMRRTVVEGT